METEQYQELFENTMDLLFENVDKRKLFYYKSRAFYNLPDEGGVYAVMSLDGFKFEILKEPQGPKTYKGREIPKPDKKIADVNRKYLYVAKAGTSLKTRIMQFTTFGYTTGNSTMGHNVGTNLWYVNNNKNFFLGYITNEGVKKYAYELLYKPAEEIYQFVSKTKKKRTDIADCISVGLVELHRAGYLGLAPFGQRESDKDVIEVKEFWADHWRNYKG